MTFSGKIESCRWIKYYPLSWKKQYLRDENQRKKMENLSFLQNTGWIFTKTED